MLVVHQGLDNRSDLVDDIIWLEVLDQDSELLSGDILQLGLVVDHEFSVIRKNQSLRVLSSGRFTNLIQLSLKILRRRCEEYKRI